jgi:excisionase family DNA binding protein
MQGTPSDQYRGGTPAWLLESSRIALELAEALNFAPITPDIEFVAFLRANSQFGFFRFGPVTIDVNVVEDILMRTHPRGEGNLDHPASSPDYVEWGEQLWRFAERRSIPRIDELTTLLCHMNWKRGLQARVFGELGVTAEDVERYAAELGGAPKPPASPARKLYSTEDAAEYLGVHVQTVRSWIRSGKLPASRLAGQKSIRIREADLEAVLEPIDPRQFDA